MKKLITIISLTIVNILVLTLYFLLKYLVCMYDVITLKYDRFWKDFKTIKEL